MASWRYGPGGASAIFECEDDVPEGWTDHPCKVKSEELAVAKAEVAKMDLDGDGNVGGSLPKEKRKPRQKAVKRESR